MKRAPKVAGLIITKNQENSIEKSVKSMLEQDTSLSEVLVVDDLSTDDTSRIINSYAQKDNRIKYIKPTYRLGPSKALNLGLEESSSEFVLISGGDDFSLPNRSQIQSEILESNPKISVVYNRALINGEEDYFHPIEKDLLKLDLSTINFFNLLFWNLNFLCAPASALRLKRRILFNPALIQLQDFFVNLKLSQQNELKYDKRIVTNYTQTKTSLSGRVSIEGSKENQRFQNELSFIFRNLMNAITFTDILKNFSSQLPDSILRTNNRKYLIIFLLLSHEYPIVQNIGKEFFIGMLEKTNEQKKVYDFLQSNKLDISFLV